MCCGPVVRLGRPCSTWCQTDSLDPKPWMSKDCFRAADACREFRGTRIGADAVLETLLGSSIGKLGGELLSKWKERQQVHAILELHKRRIRETRLSNNRWAELRQLRDLFLQYNLADRHSENRVFFDRWLADPVVEMGWTPSGGWDLQRITRLHADLESVQA
jgi:hypothetical protein